MFKLKKMSKERKSKYLRLRSIRRERDYQNGVIQYVNRPFTARGIVPGKDGRGIPVYQTTNQFIRSSGICI